MTGLSVDVVVIIVGFRNADDVSACLTALANSDKQPSFEVFLAENGGATGMDTLIAALDAEPSCRPADSDDDLDISSPPMRRRRLFNLIDSAGAARSRVHVAEMAENLGYAGGVNAWLRPLLDLPGWGGVWVLNPDTQVMPSALSELVTYAARHQREMVGSRLVEPEDPDRGYTQGLAWSRPLARTLSVNYQRLTTTAPDRHDVEGAIDAPSGASCYVTRRLIDRIGLMNEDYFLYFEDLDWGCRAKATNSVGYAHDSVVMHRGGTTIGTSRDRAKMSPLAIYLEYRNRIIFVRTWHPTWLVWTVLMQILHVARFGGAGAFSNMMTAYKGLLAGLRGRTGRPDQIWDALARASRH